MRILPVLAALALATLIPGGGAAQPAEPAPVNGVVVAPLQDLPEDDWVGDRAERLWSDFLDLFRLGWRHSQYARGYTELDPARVRSRDDFSALMDVAGYKLKEIESHIGVAPGLQMTFGQVRELTEADREYVERHLYRHARRNTGVLAAIQRLIVFSVVEASDISGMAVDKVVIDLFPLPDVKLVVTPVDAPMSLDAGRIMRAIDALNRRLQQTSSRSGVAGPLPGAGPAGALAAR